MIIGDRRYPPKYVVSIACEIATGTQYSSNDFTTHEATAFFESRGYDVKYDAVSTRNSVEATHDEKVVHFRVMKPVLFARVGLMTFYAGSQPGDERPVGGGAYNRKSLGHERFNFADINRTLYGYFQPGAGAHSVNLQRVKSGASEFADNVLVVFVADQTVVGWYQDARVYATPRDLPSEFAAKRDGCKYYCEAPKIQCVLLPTAARKLQIPRGAGGMGQSNVTYSLDAAGHPKDAEWITRALNFIDSYNGPNLLTHQLEEAEPELDQAIQRTLATARGQKYVADAAARKAIEEHAVSTAVGYFTTQHFQVVERGKPFDLECSKSGQRLFVEVKGSQTECQEVSLTPNEVKFAREHHREMVLFVVHSIQLDGQAGEYTAQGGVGVLLSPWSPEPDNLTPAAFVYRLPPGAGLTIEVEGG